MNHHSESAEGANLRLGPLEEQVMELLWGRGALSIRNVMDTLAQNPAYTTVATVMQNLQRKNLVKAEKDGRLVSYVALISREEHTAALMRHALESSTDRAASILHFVKDMPEEERALLQAYLADPHARAVKEG